MPHKDPSQPSSLLTWAGPQLALGSHALFPACPSGWNDLPHPNLPGKCLLIQDSGSDEVFNAPIAPCPLLCGTYHPVAPSHRTLHYLSNVHFLEGLILIPWEKISAK